MRKSLLFAVLLIAATFIGQNNLPQVSAQTEWGVCSVQDPTGTPLNVRAKPNGRVLTTVRNGTLVDIDSGTATSKWARIRFDRGRKRITGWVLRDFLSCQ